MTARLQRPSFVSTLRGTALALYAGGALLGASAAGAQGTIDRDAQTVYQKEAAACRSTTRQDHATCMREAGAARDEARRGRLADRGTAYDKNATQRCNGLPDADRQDCIARMQGQDTTTSGSVDGGGILRERVTRTPAPMPVPPPTILDTRPGSPAN